MCGIAGIYTHSGAEILSDIERMADAQQHRGPDDSGSEVFSVGDGYLALGHRRLAIRDLSPAGHQPMFCPYTGNCIVFNGEIYNDAELRRDLIQRGYDFRTECDTETILVGYAAFGSSVFNKLEGMYAIGLYDLHRCRLVLACDPHGIKPLYYQASASGLSFASELRAFLSTSRPTPPLDRAGIATMLAYGAVQAPLTMLKGVRQLEPAEIIEYRLNSVADAAKTCRRSKTWAPPQPDSSWMGDDLARQELQRTIADTVTRHLVSDVPVAIALSSGVDSSAIAAIAARALSASDRLHTFTVSCKQDNHNETPDAELTARHLGASHTTVALTEHEMFSLFYQWLDAVDQPTIDGLNTFIVCDAISRHGFKAALSGLGGDELFGGYSTFVTLPRFARAMALSGRIPRHLLRASTQYGRDPIAGGRISKLSDVLREPFTFERLALRSRRVFGNRQLEAIGFSPDALGLNDEFLPYDLTGDEQAGDDPIAALSRIESRTYMSNMLLRDADVFSMAHSLELRVPFVHRPLANIVHQIPGEARLRRGVNKPLLYDAVADLLPPDLGHRAKRGFSIDQAVWMKTALREPFTAALESFCSIDGVPSRLVMQEWERFVSGPSTQPWSRFWGLAIVGHWYTKSLSSRTLIAA